MTEPTQSFVYRSVETEHGQQRSVDSPLLFWCEMASRVTKSPEVDRPHLLDEHPSNGALNVDLGSERCRLRTGRCRRNQDDRPWEERIRLHNDAEPTSSLLMTGTLPETQGEDVTPTHGGLP